MKTIWKYEPQLGRSTKVIKLDLPKQFQILEVQFNYPKYKIGRMAVDFWIGVNSEDETEERIFDCFDTGQEIPECEFGRTHVATINVPECAMVKHILLRNLS